MKEIRICWKLGAMHGGGSWYLDTERVRQALRAQIETLNAEHGPGSHWLDERDA